MSSVLDTAVIESIKAGEDPDFTLATFESIYGEVQYPPVSVYKALMFCQAISCESDALVNRLLDSGYDVNYSFGYVTPAPLNIAIQIGREDYVRNLLEAGASVNDENCADANRFDEVCTALELAIKLDRWSLAELMIPLYDRRKTRTGRTPLHFACLHGSRECVERILSTAEGRADVNALDGDDKHFPEGYTPLMLVVHHGSWLVEKILRNGADATIVRSRSRGSALVLACCQNIHSSGQVHRFVSRDLPQVIRLLVEAGCDPNESEKCGDTPLSLLLTQISCELTAQTSIGYPYALETHRQVILDSVTTLLELGASPDGHVKRTPISVLVYQLNSILRILCHNDHDPDARDAFVSSALHATCLARDLIEILLMKRANTKLMYGCGSSSVFDSFLDGVIQSFGDFNDSGRVMYTTDVLCVFADIFRILLLSCDSFSKTSFVFSMYFKQVPQSYVFITLLFNYYGIEKFRSLMSQALNEHRLVNKSCLEALVALTQNEPCRLKDCARVAIVKSLGNRALTDTAALCLPSYLKDYILSLA